MELAEQFKEAFRYHPGGIAVITAQTPDGPVGLTASSVASVSIDPVALVFSVTRATGSAGGILEADTFVVHLIDSIHQDLAMSFAVSGAERFTPEQGWSTLETGEPYHPEARVALRCRAISKTPVGPSSVVVAEVLSVHNLDLENPIKNPPLVYHDRKFYNLETN